MKSKLVTILLFILLLCALTSACSGLSLVQGDGRTPEATTRSVEIVTATPSPSPTPTPEPTPEPTPTPVPTPDGLCGGRYDVFTDGEVIETENSYQTDRIALFYEELVWTKEDSPIGKRMYIHICHIYVQDIESFQAFTYREHTRMKAIATKVDAVFAISGDFYAWRDEGLVVRNGEVIRATVDTYRDICVIYRDGRMESFERGHYSADIAQDPDVWHILSFGPILLDEEGRALKQFHTEGVSASGRPVTSNPGHYATRTARVGIGYYAPGHYVIVNVEFPGKRSAGIYMTEFAELMESLGCEKAYNLDGGRTARMWFGNALRCDGETPERSLLDVLAICRVAP
ncbi:MAG: phosphodiester glycosidase family protein [Clostridiales bacterium]|nr:phosphodiester glycosidase family protein [Clostridiales bacterium]